MADNYLEKKMEEHRNRGSLPRRNTNSHGLPKGTLPVRLAIDTVFIYSDETWPEGVEEIVKAFGSTGVKTGFVWSNLAFGRRLAQSTASIHYPFAPADISKARTLFQGKNGNIAFDIFIKKGECIIEAYEKHLILRNPVPEQIAQTALWLAFELAELFWKLESEIAFEGVEF